MKELSKKQFIALFFFFSFFFYFYLYIDLFFIHNIWATPALLIGGVYSFVIPNIVEKIIYGSIYEGVPILARSAILLSMGFTIGYTRPGRIVSKMLIITSIFFVLKLTGTKLILLRILNLAIVDYESFSIFLLPNLEIVYRHVDFLIPTLGSYLGYLLAKKRKLPL